MTKINQSNSRGNREIPVTVVQAFSVGADELRHQRIAEKAHEIYESRVVVTGAIWTIGSRPNERF